MKRRYAIRLFAAAIAFAAGTDSKATEYNPRVLSDAWFVKMDLDRDGKISPTEYLRFGTACLQKRGKRVDPRCIQDEFNSFDWNGDGFITAEDPLCPDPIEEFLEKLKGRWTCENNNNRTVFFTFMGGGEGEVVRNRLSLKGEAQGLLYSIVYPGRTPVCLDITLAGGTSAEQHLKCIIEFLTDSKLKMRAFTGKADTPFPEEFAPEHDADTYHLTRVVKKEKPKPISQPEPESGGMTIFGSRVPLRRR